MNPDRPSREQIEVRLTALLLGELPADEAELLRWTISQDTELQKLHGRLLLTVGLVRETIAHPAEASAEKSVPRTLSDERRNKLLAFFKTPRPRPDQKELFWLKRIEVRPLVIALALVAIVAVLAAMFLPALAAAKRKGVHVTMMSGRAMPADENTPDASQLNASTKALRGKGQPDVGWSANLAAATPPPVPTVAPPPKMEIVLPEVQTSGAGLRSQSQPTLMATPASAAAETEIRVFPMKYGSPTEVANELGSVFQKPGQQNGQKAQEINAVADSRIQAVIVTAPKDVMPEVSSLMDELDVASDRDQNVATVQLDNSDPQQVAQTLQNMFGNGNPSRRVANSQSSVLQQRAQNATTMLGGTVASGNMGGGGGLGGGSGGSTQNSALQQRAQNATTGVGETTPTTSGGMGGGGFGGGGGGGGGNPFAALFGGRVGGRGSSASPTPDTATLEGIPPGTRQNTEANSLVQDGKVLYEAGEFKEAEDKLNQALKADPNSQGAYYYLSLDKQAQYGRDELDRTAQGGDAMVEVAKAWTPQLGVPSPAPSPSPSTAPATPSGSTTPGFDMYLGNYVNGGVIANNGMVGSANIAADPNTHNLVVTADQRAMDQIKETLSQLDKSSSTLAGGYPAATTQSDSFDLATSSAAPTTPTSGTTTVWYTFADDSSGTGNQSGDGRHFGAMLGPVPNSGSGPTEAAANERLRGVSAAASSDVAVVEKPASAGSEQRFFRISNADGENSADKTPTLGDLPVQGRLFSSTAIYAPTPAMAPPPASAPVVPSMDLRVNIEAPKNMAEDLARKPVSAGGTVEFSNGSAFSSVNGVVANNGTLTTSGDTLALAATNSVLGGNVANNGTLAYRTSDQTLSSGLRNQQGGGRAESASQPQTAIPAGFQPTNAFALNDNKFFTGFTRDDVGHLRSFLDTDPQATAPSPALTQQQLQQYKAQQIEQEKDFKKVSEQLAQLQALQATNPAELRDVLPTMVADKTLGDLSAKLQQTEQSLARLKQDYGVSYPDVVRQQALADQLNRQIDSRVTGVISDLSRQENSLKAALDAQTAAIEAAIKKDQQEAERTKPSANAATSTKDLTLNYQNVPLDQVLSYLSDSAGLIVVQGTRFNGNVTIKGDHLTQDEVLNQLNSELNRNGYAAIREGRVLTIMQKTETRTSDVPIQKSPQPAPVPQPEFLTRENAFSTFSMNVSDVSFKLAQASLQKGQMPDPASIRSEEFINAFNYRDPEAAAGQPLAFASELARDPFAHNRDFLRFSVKTAAAGRPADRPLNLVLLLDTSGSMERADRVAIIREALRVLASQLQPQDTVSVVTFARMARLWADGVSGDQAGATLDRVGGITPDGGTNLEEAMRLAYETAHRHYLAQGVNRVVLLTDGAANLGNVDPETLKQNVEAQRRQGIALDCFGIGWEDFNDDLLEELSGNGDGRYAFINSPEEADSDFAAKLAGALQVAAQDVKVQVEFNPQRVVSWRQIGYAKHQLTKEQFRDNSMLAAEIAAQEAGNALYTVETRPDGAGPVATVYVRYRIPGTQDVRERSWMVEYTGTAPALEQSGPAMKLATVAAEFSEWLAASPFAQEVTPDELLKDLSGVPQVYGADQRPQQLEWMIRQAKSIAAQPMPVSQPEPSGRGF